MSVYFVELIGPGPKTPRHIVSGFRSVIVELFRDSVRTGEKQVLPHMNTLGIGLS